MRLLCQLTVHLCLILGLLTPTWGQERNPPIKPLVVGLMDYGTKTGGLGPLIWPTGDFRADMMKVFDVYKSCIPKCPERAVRSIDDILGTDEE